MQSFQVLNVATMDKMPPLPIRIACLWMSALILSSMADLELNAVDLLDQGQSTLHVVSVRAYSFACLKKAKH